MRLISLSRPSTPTIAGRVGIAALAVAALAACGQPRETDPRMVSEWMHTLYGVIRAERLSPPVASRLMAYSTVALYSGLSSVNSKLPSVAGVLDGLPELPRAERPRDYDATLTAIAAERVVLDSLLREGVPTTRSALARLADSLALAWSAGGVSQAVQSRSQELGTQIGSKIVAWSHGDGFDTTRGRPFTPMVGLAYWVNDSPANTYAAQDLSATSAYVALDNPANVLQSGNTSDRGLILNRPKRSGVKTLPAVNMAGLSEPYWGHIRPFVLKKWNECAAPEPPVYSTDTTSPMYRDAEVVRETRVHMTPANRAVAFYWADNAGESGTPVGHWISIASQLVGERHLSGDDAARLVMMTALAQADAFIAAWGYKFQYSLLRPRTFIRRMIDSTWEPLIPTPPFPEYPSAHSTQSAAAATVLGAVIGDHVAFEDSTDLSIGNGVRRFESFRAAASEAGISRIYAGIHFPYGNTGGRALGDCVGEKVVERLNAVSLR
jgi:membrane-associated phospholipid phosphatase